MSGKIDGAYHHPDDIVISGISGMFPASENIEEFKKNLFGGIDMITMVPKRERSGKFRRMGAMKNTDRFDNEFFHMNYTETEDMACCSRLLLERIVEAVMDAGYNLKQMKNKNIGVVCGHFDGFMDENNTVDFGEDATGPKQSHFLPANLISRFFEINGPSVTLHTACSASLIAFDYAINAIRNGDCEGALVGASNLCKTPSDEYFEMGLLSPTGISRPFDAAGDGFTRSEATVALFLQKRKDARRIYANIIHSKINSDGYKSHGILFPSVKLQKKLYSDVYKEINMDPSNISFLEAHGTGTKAGDVVEGTSIEEFFCANRKTPLKIGSVKSNMGHAEGAAGCCSLVKMIISFEEGVIPANIKFDDPNPKIKGLFNGKLEVITKHTPVEGKYFAISSFGVGGSNGHVLISPHDKEKKRRGEFTDDNLPRFVTVSGRTHDAVNCILKDVEKNYRDCEYIRLIHEIFSENIDGYFHRGFTILNNNGSRILSKNVFCNKKRPLWFIFSGMGSEWPLHGVSLMKIPIFAESINNSHKVLESKGVNLLNLITSNNPQIIKNTLNAYVGIVAIQIALVDVLKTLGVKPDGFLGLSIGELACAYIDECLTAEQTILVAYYYGLVSLEAEFLNYSTAVVGKGYNQMKNEIPSEISILSHDGPNCCIISGPEDVMQDFINDLNDKNVSVHEVQMPNIAHNNRFMKSSSSKLTSYLKKVIKEPKHRSKKWLSTSALEHFCSTSELKYCSAQYLTSNFCNPVYFEETLSHIPSNAIMIEIAPRGYFTNIPKCLPPTVENIPLMMQSSENEVEFLLTALGRMYEVGCALKLANLYPPVEFPVSKSTPMISPSIKWKHNVRWNSNELSEFEYVPSRDRMVTVNPESALFQHLKGHVIDGRNLYPGIGYLELVWDMVVSMSKRDDDKISIVFENVRFERATIVGKKALIKFWISVHLGTNRFEILENGAVVASGNVRIPHNISQEECNVESFGDEISNSDILPLNTKDFYKEMRLKGYNYDGMFKKVAYVNAEATYGRVPWNNNFTTFLDTMAQVSLLRADFREVLIPTYIRKLVINLDKHYKILETLDKENPEFPVNYHSNLGLLCCGGVQIMGIETHGLIRQPDNAEAVMEIQEFVPYICDKETNMDLVIRLCVHIAIENVLMMQVKTYEILDQEYSEEAASISHIITKTFSDLPKIQGSVNVLTKLVNEGEIEPPLGVEVSNKELPEDNSAMLIVLSDIGSKTDIFEKIFKTLKSDGFIITREFRGKSDSLKHLGFNVCFSRPINADEEIFLLKKINEQKPIFKKAIRVRNDSYVWIPEVQNVLLNIDSDKNEEFVVYAEKEPTSGISGFFNCLRMEENGMAARCFIITDETAPDFSLDSSFYKSQLDKNLSHNVYKNGRWGSYRRLPFVPAEEVEAPRIFCNLEKRGDLSSFKWVEDSLDTAGCNNWKTKSFVNVYFSSLNFRDVMLAVGRIPISSYLNLGNRLYECHIGAEYSGKDENGRRVMGMTTHKGIATIVEASDFSWTVPDHMKLEEAATIPVVYGTVVYALFFKTQLKKGSSILIHAGAGGIGQAAINICLHYGCNIFTTVGSPQKIEFIRKTYPQIPANQICYSRDTSFEKVIMEQTNGRGVDIVLNSLAGEMLKASLRCVAKGGDYLEIGKFDMFRNSCVEMDQFLNKITFHSVQLDVVIMNLSYTTLKLKNKIQELIDQGIIKPIQRTIFQADEVKAAFRYMATGKHIGKVLIKIRDEEEDLHAKPIPYPLKAKPRVLCKKDKSYLIIGGLGGFGMELSDWLIVRGARNIVLSSRTGVKNGYQSYRIKLWRSYGTNVVIATDDVTSEEGVKKLLMKANSMGPVAGIFNLALILKDNPFLNQTDETFSEVAAPKAIATAHLDKLSREMCPQLEHFVIFSSAVCGLGNVNQTNYGFSNSIMEKICELRHADNLPALAVQWGAIGDVGIVADFAENHVNIVIAGTLQQKLGSCLDKLDSFMKQQKYPIVSSMVVAEKRRADSDVINTIANILGIKDLKSISLTWTFPDLGMDSLVAVEIKQILESEYNTFFTPEDLRTMTFAKLYKLKDDKKKSLQSGKKTMRQFQRQTVNAKLMKKPFLNIPFNDAETKKPEDCEKPPLFIFPGVEGMASFMEPLAENLQFQATCFQYHFEELPINSVPKMGKHFLKLISDSLKPDQEFFIVAYSLGVFYALEVIRNLEENGKKGYLYLIDASPSYVTSKAAHYLNKNMSLSNHEAIENNICIKSLQALLPDKDLNEYFSYLEKANSWEAKKKLIISITSQMKVDDTIVNDLLDKGYTLSKMFFNYESNCKDLETQCILIRIAENQYKLDESYGLTEFFKNPVQVHKIEANHYTIVGNPRTAEIINDCPLWKNYLKKN